jgi:hypothetical protein
MFKTDQPCANPVLGYRKTMAIDPIYCFSRNSLFDCKSRQSSIRYARKDNNESDDENVPLGFDGEEDEKALDATEHKGSKQCSKERYSAAS